MTIISLTLLGDPITEQRVRKGKHGNFYNPQQDVMNKTRNILNRQIPADFSLSKKKIPIKAEITFYFKPSKSEMKNKELVAALESESYPYLKKPDIDNVEKFIYDRLNKNLFADDSHIFSNANHKFYSMNPRTEIQITFYEEYLNAEKQTRRKGTETKGQKTAKKSANRKNKKRYCAS